MSHLTFSATGDSFITRRLPSVEESSFTNLAKIIQQTDFRFTNLETTVHREEGFPSANSGGTWAMSSPDVLKDLQAYGFNVLAWANNHSLDYLHDGLLATERYLDEANFIHSGVGKNLAAASAPKYLETKNGRVAIISVTSTIHESGIAGEQRPDLIGRPGVNPLRYETTFYVTQEEMKALQSIAEKTDINARRDLSIKEGFILPDNDEVFYFGQYKFVQGPETKKVTTPHEADMKRMIEKISEAKRQADAVVISIHSHEMDGTDKAEPAQFLVEAAKQSIDAGADAIIGHGPHILRGIEIYKNKPIFYSLGNFIFQNDSVEKLPADFYTQYNLNHEANISDALDARSDNDTRGFAMDQRFWESIVATWSMQDGEITNIRLHPIELGYGKKRHQRGWPTVVKNDDIIKQLQQLSEPFGTEITIQNGIGIIKT
ncbi:MAG TPA: CapA family protein [Bacillota bacterium]|nr:CapA family protein [Bacillota bacterium]